MKNLFFKKSAFVLNIFIVSSLLFAGCTGNVSAVCVTLDGICGSGENIFNCPADCPLPVGIPNKLIPDVIDSAISWLLGFAVAISVVALIYGGTLYVFSSGDAQKTENAKKVVKYALIGIFITGVSFAIVTIIDTIFH